MSETLHVVRKGHMGDVLLAEPIASALRPRFTKVVLYTDYAQAGALMPVFDEVRPFLEGGGPQCGPRDRKLKLVYEIWPGINHLDGYARCAGVELSYRVPRVRRESKRLMADDYVLIAPHTSHWIRSMRQWDPAKAAAVGELLREKLGLRLMTLRPDHSFAEMVSLVEHCSAFLGNDSGPAILAQCFNRRSAVIFGATSPERVLLSDSALAVYRNVGCNGCKHFARHTDIECASPVCLTDLSVREVFEAVAALLNDVPWRPSTGAIV